MKMGRFVLSIILVLISCDMIIINCALMTSKENDLEGNKRIRRELEERLDIIHDSNVLKLIKPGVLTLVGNASQVTLECKSTRNSASFIKWIYHGSRKNAVTVEQNQNLAYLKNFEEGPPVARMECLDREYTSMSNNTLIYRGDGQPPYLYKNGETLSVMALNQTTVYLPCLLNYPLDDLDHFELQLFKDDVQIKNMSYKPEYGYILNLTSLEQPFGSYECRVKNLANSTDYNEESIKLELKNDEIIETEIQVEHEHYLSTFYKGEPFERIFFCKIPKSTFENRFEWFYLLSNGSYVPLHPVTVPSRKDKQDKLFYVNLIKVRFSNTDITHVVCRAFTKDNESSYNNTYPVEIKEPKMSKIVNGSSLSAHPIVYKEGMNLTCVSEGDPPTAIHWLKNEILVDADIASSFANDMTESTLKVEQSPDESGTNYTCVAENFMGNATATYRVQLKADVEPDSSNEFLKTLSIGLVAVTLFLLLLLIVSKPKRKPREFSEEKIRRFLEGLQVGDSSVAEDYEEYESVSYDSSRELPANYLRLGEPLKEGHFGKVYFGFYRHPTTGNNIPVAVKSIKDKPIVTLQDVEDVEIAFANFLKEIKIMQMLGEHPNVVKYIGADTSCLRQYKAFLVVEYCSEGDLRTYLQALQDRGGAFHDDIQGLHIDLQSACSHSNNTTREQQSMPYQTIENGEFVETTSRAVLTTSHLIKWAQEIACGMEYVALKNLVHRDIAARNILLSYEDRVCSRRDPGMLRAKISDFGMSKNLHENPVPKDYYAIVDLNRRIHLPLRWMSVEALQTLKFTTQGDVWSYGVTLWEMFTLGKYPYENLRDEDAFQQTMLNYLNQGNTLPQPELAPRDIWEVMSSSWIRKPNERPNFSTLNEQLQVINVSIERQENQQDEDGPAEWDGPVVQSDEEDSLENQGEHLEIEETCL